MQKMKEEWQFGLKNNGNTCFINAAIQLIIHCVMELDWLNQTDSKVTNKLKEIINSQGDNQKLIEFYSLLNYNGKNQQSLKGGDPVRVLSAFILQSHTKGKLLEMLDQNSYLMKDFKYWAEDNSVTSYLFQTVHFNGIYCSICKEQKILEEEQNFVINISKHQIKKTIQQTLIHKFQVQKISSPPPQQNNSKKICEHSQQNDYQIQEVNGLLKLSKFLLINIDEKVDLTKLTIDKRIELFDQVRDQKVIYQLRGFICLAPFHYTYFKDLGNNKWRHFNDDYVETINTNIEDQIPKILLYSCIKNQDPNIEVITKPKNPLLFQQINQKNTIEALSFNNQHIEINPNYHHQITTNVKNHERQSNQFKEQNQNPVIVSQQWLLPQKQQNNQLPISANNTMISSQANSLNVTCFPEQQNQNNVVTQKIVSEIVTDHSKNQTLQSSIENESQPNKCLWLCGSLIFLILLAILMISICTHRI